MTAPLTDSMADGGWVAWAATLEVGLFVLSLILAIAVVVRILRAR
jgi:hypothetical protein